jgi:hypothetical protein
MVPWNVASLVNHPEEHRSSLAWLNMTKNVVPVEIGKSIVGKDTRKSLEFSVAPENHSGTQHFALTLRHGKTTYYDARGVAEYDLKERNGVHWARNVS